MALISTVVEDWSGGINAGIWNNWGGSPYVTLDAGRLKLTHTTASNYYGIETQVGYDWTNSGATLEIVSLPVLDNVNDPEYSVTFGAEIDANNRFYFGYEGTSVLVCMKVVAGAYQYQGEVAYNSTDHKFLRIRFSATHCFWEVSANGSSWTQVATVAITGVAITALKLNIGNGNWAAVATVQTAMFDRINIVPTAQTLTLGAGTASQAAVGTPSIRNAQQGKFTNGGTVASNSTDRKVLSKFTVTDVGKVTNFHARVWLSATGTAGWRGIIHADNAGAVGALLSVSDNATLTATAEAVASIAVSGANQIVLVPGDYWFGVHWQDPGTPTFNISKDNNANDRREAADTYADGTASAFGTETLLTGKVDVYVTTTEVLAIAPTGIASTAAFGTHALAIGAIPSQNLAPSSIASTSNMGVPVLANYVNPPILTGLVDTFDTPPVNAGRWDNWGNAVVDAGRLKLTKPEGGDYYGIGSNAAYSIKESKVYVELLDPGNIYDNDTYECTVLLVENAARTTRIYMTLSYGTITCWYYLGGIYYNQGQVAYDPEAHKWFQIREVNDVLYFEYGLTGQDDWQLLAAVDTDPTLDLDNLYFSIQIGDYAPLEGTAPVAYAYFDNLNMPMTYAQDLAPSGFEATSDLLRFGLPDIADPLLQKIRDPGNIASVMAVGTPTLIGEGRLTMTGIDGGAAVGKPTMTGVLATNDTAPSYEFYRRAFLPLRNINAGVRISFNRGYDADAAFFEIGTSALNSGDVLQGDGSTIQEWDKFDFDDYSQFISSIQYHQEQDRLGSMVMGYADIALRNLDGRFSPYGDSPIAALILPNRPLKIFAGFGGSEMQVFVGQTMRLPEATKEAAKFHAKDFIASFADTEVTLGKVYVAQRTDQIIDDILQNTVGLSPVQYTLDVGANTISFLHVEPGTKVGELLRKLCEAESGRFYQDPDGRMIFKNRTNKQRATALRLIPEMILSEKEPQAANVINRVKITSDVRTVMGSQQVYPGLKDGSTTTYDDFQSFEVPANSSVEKFFDMKDPVTSYTHPTVGGGITANAAQDGSGASRNADLSRSVDASFTNAVKYTFTNSSGTALYVTACTINGTPARVSSQIRVDVSDATSIEKYGEKLLDIKNDAFTSNSFATTIANEIVDANAEAPNTREITMRGIPYMQVGDVVEYRDGDDYVVDMISGKIGAGDGNRQEARLRRI